MRAGCTASATQGRIPAARSRSACTVTRPSQCRRTSSALEAPASLAQVTAARSPDRARVRHQACGRPLAWFPIRAAFALDCAPVVTVVGHQADLVEKELTELFPGAPLEFALQKEQLGTGHAVLCAQAALKKSGFAD